MSPREWNTLFQVEQFIPAGSGWEAQPSWSGVGEIWGGVRAMTGKEMFLAGHIEGGHVWVVETRYNDLVTDRCRLVTDGDTFNVLFVDNVNRRNRDMLLTVQESHEA